MFKLREDSSESFSEKIRHNEIAFENADGSVLLRKEDPIEMASQGFSKHLFLLAALLIFFL